MSNQKPVRDRRVVGRQIWRIPENGYVIPRLRPSEAKDAIGFLHSFDCEDGYTEDSTR